MKFLPPIFVTSIIALIGTVAYAQYKPSTVLLTTYNAATTTLIKEANTDTNHSMFLEAIEVAGLDALLESKGKFTIFAPSDRAFNKLSKGEFETLLLPENIEKLRAMLSYHIIIGEYTASTILKTLCNSKGLTRYTTVQGNKITATMNGIDIVLTDHMGNTAIITKADIMKSNGVIHDIDTVMRPNITASSVANAAARAQD